MYVRILVTARVTVATRKAKTLDMIDSVISVVVLILVMVVMV